MPTTVGNEAMPKMFLTSPVRFACLAIVTFAVASPAIAGDFSLTSLKKHLPWTKRAEGCDAVDGCVTQDCGPVETELCAPAYEQPVCEQPACDIACAPNGCDGTCAPACGPDCGLGGLGKGPCWGSEEWYAMRAHLPPGERPRIKHGKLTPVVPRPNLPPQPFWHQYHSANNWPHPYDCVDRAGVKSIMTTQMDRGWANLTTLHHFHFDQKTQTLNAKGLAKVNYVMTGVPMSHRALYVANDDPRLTEIRMANVRASVAEASGYGAPLAVIPRTASALTRPAIEVDQINRTRLSTMLPPTITYSGGGGAE